MSTASERAEILKRTMVFSALSEADLRALAPVFRPRVLADGQHLFKAGEPGDYLAVVVRGVLCVDVSSTPAVRASAGELGAFDVVGEMACLDPAPRSASVMARGEVEVLILTRVMLDALRINAVGLFAAVIGGLSRRVTERVRETNARISKLLWARREAIKSPAGSIEGYFLDAASPTLHRGPLDLASLVALRSFAPAELGALQGAARALHFADGALLCRESDPGASCFIICQGRADVVKIVGGRAYSFASIAEGSLVGQMALLDRVERSATVRARGELVALELSRDSFEALLRAHSPLAVRFQELVTISGIRQLRLANAMLAFLIERGVQTPSALAAQMPEVDAQHDELGALAQAYLQTALGEWNVTPSELKNIRVAKLDGMISQAELQGRLKK
ncbi:MAG: cyclic nucleotide-binding domain-containing protein [Bradymonadaceae bacterium]|nr:cyclic nucleotide-binding domain-containing protein [Lujinxingiaceae bacterium]